MNENQAAKQIVEVCQRLYQRNMLASADGNISARLEDGRILITPSGKAKAFLSPDEMAVMTLEGEILKGKPSSERLMHLEIYRQCPQALAVVHAHPPTAIAWSIARPDLEELPADCLSEVILATGRIPFVPYARPSTAAMGENLRPFLPSHRVMILSRHGGLCWGESLEEATNGMERLEHSAQILMSAHQLGGLNPLPAEEVQALKEMRQQIGDKIL